MVGCSIPPSIEKVRHATNPAGWGWRKNSMLGSLAGVTSQESYSPKTQLLINREIWPVILEQINSAKFEIFIIFPWIKYKPLVDTLIKVKKQRPQVKIKVISSTKGVVNGGYDSVHEENIRKLDEAGIQVQTIFKPFVHPKSVCVDGKVLITGSANASFSAANLNVEHAMITGDKEAIERFEKEFNKLWHDALLCGVIMRGDSAKK